MSFSVAQAQSDTSYIIVHALNPEGVEIASIEGMEPYCVRIYDGDRFIGYGSYNEETHNKPIEISPGTHIIKVYFNGMTKEQNVTLNHGETETFTFTFDRTERHTFLKEILDSQGVVEWDVKKAGAWDVYHSHKYLKIRTSVYAPWYGWDYSISGLGHAELSSQRLRVSVRYSSFDPICPPHGRLAIEDVLAGVKVDTDDLFLPSELSFSKWFTQGFIGGSDKKKIGQLVLRSGSQYSSLTPLKVSDLSNEPCYYLRSVPTLPYSDLSIGPYDSYFEHHEGYSRVGTIGYITYREDRTPQIKISYYDVDASVLPDLFRLASVPYDLLGTGIRVEGRLIITEAKTDKESYLVNEEVKISCIVKDESGTYVSTADVKAEVIKPDDSRETVTLKETEPGTYEGTFSDTTLPGTYDVTIKAEKERYTPATAELSFTVGPILEILDGVDFTAGTEVSSDPQKIASGGTAVKGAVTDGVTRLLLRLNVGELNEVTFTLQGTGNPEEDGVLRSIDGTQEGNSITVTTVNVNEKEYAFAIYQAPENFVRWDYRDQDRKVSERTISLNVKSNRSPSFEFSEEIKLLRPPVILVHGLWSSSKMWVSTLEKLFSEISGIDLLCANYKPTNDSSFETNKKVVREYINKVKGRIKSEKIAVTQADVIGHSMGGLLARIWAGAEASKNKYNFQIGDVNKLITLDSSYYGSFLAEAAIKCLRRPHSTMVDVLVTSMEALGYSLTNGAVEDMMIMSEPIEKMNSIKIMPLSHTIAGDYTKIRVVAYVDPDGKTILLIEGIPTNYFDIHNLLIDEGYGYIIIPNIQFAGTDVVISVDSQKGGLGSSASSVFDHHHMDATTQDVVNQVIKLLNAGVNSKLFESGFPVRE